MLPYLEIIDVIEHLISILLDDIIPDCLSSVD